MKKEFKRYVSMVNIDELENLKNEFDNTFEQLISISQKINNFKLKFEIKKAVQYEEQHKV